MLKGDSELPFQHNLYIEEGTKDQLSLNAFSFFWVVCEEGSYPMIVAYMPEVLSSFQYYYSHLFHCLDAGAMLCCFNYLCSGMFDELIR